MLEIEYENNEEMIITTITEKIHTYNNFPNKEKIVSELYQKALPKSRIAFPNENITPVQSAVLLLLYPKNGQTHLVFIERTKDNRVHSGQIAFPGGRFDSEAGDITLEDTALRETYEEIGIAKENIVTIGKLSDLYIAPSNFNVAPFIAYMHSTPYFVRCEEEVNKILEIPLSALLKQNKLKIAEFETYSGKISAPCYMWNDIKIWGATAMMLTEFLFVMQLEV